jgi:hypothetical protein
MEEEDNKQSKEEINMINNKATKQNKTNKWAQKVEARKAKHIEKQLMIESAATSNLISDKLDLPKTGTLKINVYLPDNPHSKLPTRPCYHLNSYQRKQEKPTYSQDLKSLS